jgi:hypothetical protein
MSIHTYIITITYIYIYIRTSQLMIEYLLYAQEELASNLQNLASKYGSKKKSLAKKRLELAG